MQNTLKILILFVVGAFLFPASSFAQSDSGLILTESAYDVDETVTRLVATLEEAGLTVVGTVNHAANAADVDQELRPTQLIIFGNPNLGTPLMQNSRTVAIDLPQKYLVWEDSGGRTFVTYNSVPYLAERHGLTGPEEVLTRVTGALANFAGSVAPAPADPTPTPVAETPVPPVTMPETGGPQNGSATLWVTLSLLLVGLLILAPTLRKNLSRNKIASLFILAILGGTAAAGAMLASPAQADNHAGLIINASPYTVDETVSRLKTAMETRNLNIMLTIDHAANAARVDLELPPTQLIIFGNPTIGTGLMQVNQTVGIDLPQKMLVWADEDGNVQVAYNDPAYLGQRHSLSGKDEVLTNIAGAFAAIVGEATAAE